MLLVYVAFNRDTGLLYANCLEIWLECRHNSKTESIYKKAVSHSLLTCAATGSIHYGKGKSPLLRRNAKQDSQTKPVILLIATIRRCLHVLFLSSSFSLRHSTIYLSPIKKVFFILCAMNVWFYFSAARRH